MLVSYAQNAEDIVLHRAFKNIERGFYIDIGAADPVVDSVTKLFYDKGWSGINIEPQTQHLTDLQTQRIRDTNLGVGIGLKKDKLTFYELPELPGWSSFSKEVKKKAKQQGVSVIERNIEVVPLQEIVQEHISASQTVHFLKIDVEGFETEVVKSADFSKFRPIVLVIENTQGNEWHKYIEAVGYNLTLNDGINNFYLRKESDELRALLSSPANILDGYDPYRYISVINHLRDENRVLSKKYSTIEEKYQTLLKSL